MAYRVIAPQRADRYRVSVDEYCAYWRDGFLIVRHLVPLEEVEELKRHAMDLFYGRWKWNGHCDKQARGEKPSNCHRQSSCEW